MNANDRELVGSIIQAVELALTLPEFTADDLALKLRRHDRVIRVWIDEMILCGLVEKVPGVVRHQPSTFRRTKMLGPLPPKVIAPVIHTLLPPGPGPDMRGATLSDVIPADDVPGIPWVSAVNKATGP